MVNNSDAVFFLQLNLWTVANGISMIACWLLIGSILRLPKCRSRPFNLYLIFAVLPDAYKNTSGFVANLDNMLKPEGSAIACTVIGWNDVYWFTANCWMSAIVFYQLHKMLQAAKLCQRHEPPKAFRISLHSSIVHVYAVVLASLTLIDVPFIPKATVETSCEAFPTNREQALFFWIFLLPAAIFVPMLYIIYVCADVWYKALLPVDGKTRSLLFYFARLLAVIFVITVIVIIAASFEGWAQAIAFVFFNLTGLFQVCLALLKPDVKQAFVKLITCQSPATEGNDGEGAENKHWKTTNVVSSRIVSRFSTQSRFSSQNEENKECFNDEDIEAP